MKEKVEWWKRRGRRENKEEEEESLELFNPLNDCVVKWGARSRTGASSKCDAYRDFLRASFP